MHYNFAMMPIRLLPFFTNSGKAVLLLFIAGICCLSCSKKNAQVIETPHVIETSGAQGQAGSELPDLADTITRLFLEPGRTDPDREAFVEDFWRWIFGEAGIPEYLARKVAASALDSPSFVMELLIILQQDPFTFYLVDKKNYMPDGYAPDDLVPLTAGAYRLNRDGLQLRKIAADSLQEMALAASAEGINLVAGSAYRSVANQAQIYEREVRTYGRETADRQSARPGTSQHQLGLALDFAPISDAFAETPASQWLIDNAGSFGWSLSFPDGYEEVTGYRWESWHYRYVGRDLAAFIDKYFDGIQQYALQFIKAWQSLKE